MFLEDYKLPKLHRYYVFATGVKFRNRYFDSRVEAEIAMNKFCNKHSIKLEQTEFDKHERKYSNHKGVRFYINRV